MIMTGEKPKYSEKICPSATLSTSNLTCTGLESRSGLFGERPTTNRLRHGKAPVKTKIYLNYIQRFRSYPAVNTLILGFKHQSADAKYENNGTSF